MLKVNLTSFTYLSNWDSSNEESRLKRSRNSSTLLSKKSSSFVSLSNLEIFLTKLFTLDPNAIKLVAQPKRDCFELIILDQITIKVRDFKIVAASFLTNEQILIFVSLSKLNCQSWLFMFTTELADGRLEFGSTSIASESASESNDLPQHPSLDRS